ncbi:FIST N-terminal domain-containing protein [Prosthecochloris sp.]|uniref:FIST signal transduction protein n=1 Tax=Prosthecochloris sp. TaxID=290513 RepID=UPI0025E1BA7A|nr:FIST N-terminal domain-containing protein [Prosthecochloris sp.]
MSALTVGVGTSHLENSHDAGAEACKIAFDKTDGKADVLLVFAAMRFEHKALLSGINAVAGEVPMVGGTTAGEISPEGFSEGSVVVMAITSSMLSFDSGIGLHMSNDEDACARSLIADIFTDAVIEEASSLLVFPNGMGGDGLRVLKGLQDVLGKNFEIVGGYLGDDMRFKHTFQYFNGKVYRDAIVGLLVSLKGDVRTSIGVRSGFESIGNSFYCTSSEGNVVKEFDNVSALGLYREFLGEERFRRLPGICMEYPFGLIDENAGSSGERYFQLRCGLNVDKKKGTITFAASIPEGSAVTLTSASRGDVINGAREAAQQAMKRLRGVKPELIVMFSCVGRKLVLGRRTSEEVEVVRKCLGYDVPIIGFYTYGEIGPIDSSVEKLAEAKFHNETVVLWLLGSA